MLVMEFVTKLQECVEKWLAGKQQEARFPQNIARLKQDLEIWEVEMATRSLPAGENSRLGKILREVKSRIDEAREKHDASLRSGTMSRLCSSLRIRQSSMGEELDDIDRLLKSILELLRDDCERQILLDREVQRQPLEDPPIPSDSRYVHRTKSEVAVFKALQETHPARYILLCSAGGMGKSTLVRNLVTQQYEDGGALDSPFKSTVFVSCVDSKDIKDIMAEIIRNLGHTPVPCASAESDSREVEMEVQGNRKLLLRLLAAVRALIVLDDVSDEEYLGQITELCGSRVKCLVTSRNSDLLRRNNESLCAVIPMEPLDEKEAMTILASHAGLANHFVPEDLQMSAGKMVEKAENIPVVLASLGSTIAPNRRYDIDEWEQAYANFSDALKTKPTAAVHKGIYRKSFWAATRLAVAELSEDARKLLVLASVCAGPTVPEEPLRILYDSGKFFVGAGNFSAARKDLERSQLIKIDPVTSPIQENRRQWSWSIHSLHRQYLGEELTLDRDSMFKRLNLGDSMFKRPNLDDPDLTVEALCYLHLSWSHEISGFELLKRRGLELLRRRAIRSAVAPIIFLLGRTVVNKWTSMDNLCAKQVLVAFTLERRVVPNRLAHLLKHPEAAPAAWMALKGMVNLYSSFRFMEKDVDDELRKVFLERLEACVDSSMQAEALEVIACARMLDFYEFVFNCSKKKSSVYDDTMVAAIVGLLRRAPANSEVKALCLRALTNLASWAWKIHCHASKAETLAEHRELMDEMTDALSSDASLSLQEDAGKFLNQVTGQSSIDRSVGVLFQRNILKMYPKLLSDVGNVLSREQSVAAPVQIELLEVLVTLTNGADPFVVSTVADDDALLQALARLLHQGLHGTSVSSLLEVLYNLCMSRDGSIIAKVRSIGGLMSDLRSIVAETDANGELQPVMVRAVGLFILLDAEEASSIDLQSAAGLRARGEAYYELSMDEESQKDICRAHELDSNFATDLYREFYDKSNDNKWVITVAKMRPLRHCLSMHNKRREIAESEKATKWKNCWIQLIGEGILQIPDPLKVPEATGPPPQKLLRRS